MPVDGLGVGDGVGDGLEPEDGDGDGLGNGAPMPPVGAGGVEPSLPQAVTRPARTSANALLDETRVRAFFMVSTHRFIVPKIS